MGTKQALASAPLHHQDLQIEEPGILEPLALHQAVTYLIHLYKGKQNNENCILEMIEN